MRDVRGKGVLGKRAMERERQWRQEEGDGERRRAMERGGGRRREDGRRRAMELGQW